MRCSFSTELAGGARRSPSIAVIFTGVLVSPDVEIMTPIMATVETTGGRTKDSLIQKPCKPPCSACHGSRGLP
ncbi:hypothetical protein Pla52o_13620 [Novipirellula galeiformis]|uniref:Uncharacterized protein n=1 Tax=Novipirellula galeiformis TaxID=2528004 RepID=A0A5C6CLX2_9BACT|nr:hypothetical protein Pla52o_13620 [Novipirellula galeiformis]